MKTISIHEFIKKNERLLLVLSIFLTFLPFSFDTINKINSLYAGITAIATSVVLIIILRNLVIKKGEELSLEASIFFLSLTVISGVICLLTYNMYNSLTLSFLDLLLSLGYFVLSVVLMAKLIKWLNKIKNLRPLINGILFLLSISLIYIENIEKFLEAFLVNLNLVFPPIITIEYEIIFFTGILFIILMYGLLVSGIGYFGKEIIYKKFIENRLLKRFRYIRGSIKDLFKIKGKNFLRTLLNILFLQHLLLFS